MVPKVVGNPCGVFPVREIESVFAFNETGKSNGLLQLHRRCKHPRRQTILLQAHISIQWIKFLYGKLLGTARENFASSDS